jgi:hypothetical protein
VLNADEIFITRGIRGLLLFVRMLVEAFIFANVRRWVSGIKEEEAAFLQEYAEGWISAVYLCILGYRQNGRVERQPGEKILFKYCLDGIL